MISWAIAHAPYFGVGIAAYVAGLVRAATVQLKRERLERWLQRQRSINYSA